MKNILARFLVAVPLIAVFVISAHADTIVTLSMTGGVSSVVDANSYFGGAITVGESYSGFAQYDLSAVGGGSYLLGATPVEDYEMNSLGGVLSEMMSFDIGADTFTSTIATGHADEIEVRGDGSIFLDSNSDFTVPNPNIGFPDWEVIGQHTPSASIALPSASQLSHNPAAWSVQLFYGNYPSNYAQIDLNVQSLTITTQNVSAGGPTPEPGTAGLALLSLTAPMLIRFRSVWIGAGS